MCGSVRICFSFTQLPAVREDSSQFLPIAATAGNIYRRCEDRHLTANKRLKNKVLSIRNVTKR